MRSLVWFGIVAALVIGAMATIGRPEQPPETRNLPGGDPRIALDCRWIAPYVATYDTRLGEHWSARTVWYAEDGAVIREVNGSGMGCVAVAKDDKWMVHGTLAAWSVALPPLPTTANSNLYLGTSGDGRTFYREIRERDGTNAADVWVDGEPAGRVGPAKTESQFYVAEDGSLAIVAAPAAGERRLVVFGPRAKPSFDAPCRVGDEIDSVAPGGRGAVVRREGKSGASGLVFVGRDAERPLDVGISPHVIAWALPAKLLVASGVGADMQLRLVDVDTGAVLWHVEDQPLGGFRSSQPAAVEGDLVLVSGLEPQNVDGASHWRRRVDALDLATGKRVAIWRSDFVGPIGYAEAPHFAKRGERLFLVARDTFAPVRLADVREKSHGWE